MIIKGQARGRSRQLAAHLLRRDQNEDIHLYELRGVVAQDVAGALAEMEALTAAVHSKRPLYHASISPEAHTPLAPDQIRTAADTLERKLGLHGQPRVVVVHRKKDREHVHVVWSRIDVERQRVISDGWNYLAHEEAARELEAAFGHRAIRGAHGPRGTSRRRRAPQDYEYRQAERSGISPAEVSAELTALWQSSTDGETFRRRLEEAGYVLARGDRRVFVVIDHAGNAHSLARRLGVTTLDLRIRFGGLDLDSLPSVAQARTAWRWTGRAEVGTRFHAAAREIAILKKPSRIAARIRPRRSAQHAAAIRWINLVQHEPRTIMRRIATGPASRDRRYLAMRAIVLAEFAKKMDAAAVQLSGDAFVSALMRLAEEQDAALRALKRMEGPTAARPRATRAIARRRLRPRRVLAKRS